MENINWVSVGVYTYLAVGLVFCIVSIVRWNAKDISRKHYQRFISCSAWNLLFLFSELKMLTSVQLTYNFETPIWVAISVIVLAFLIIFLLIDGHGYAGPLEDIKDTKH